VRHIDAQPFWLRCFRHGVMRILISSSTGIITRIQSPVLLDKSRHKPYCVFIYTFKYIAMSISWRSLCPHTQVMNL
jgi:hypothetical protein